ncbi:Eco57I restriction-modification methylase domain-containing protein [Halorussus aquaticus]|uniref:site-specific DNA-methyltransferase (adenine-specific) n=1 Tax=Halorussus aquaticus TaxID=2953748 RepID=A0ABD5Q0U7_9EURY|nr:TaqI-like C-terminal specificity domain-containing protein [Halorussus aquaticus]
MSQSTLSQNPYRNSNLFSGHYLKERIKELDEWEDAEGVEAAFDQLQELWKKEDTLVAGHKEDPLIDKWIEPVLEILGHETIPEQTLPDGGGYVDRLLYESEEVYREAAERKLKDDPGGTFGKASALLEAKQWNANFTKRFSEDRQYRDASHQVKFYLERTPENIQWGILTNGKQWRLYGTKDYETQTFYEVDLPELLESGTVEDFKYFHLFFRPEAFKSVAGDTFLDTVWNESETAAQELGEDLQDNVFTALRVLGKGFLETNDLSIDPDDDEALDELKEQSLVLLYRLMFILYAESRHLINPDDPEAQREYEENFSLDQKRVEIRDAIQEGETFDSAYSEYSTSIWQRLQDLFRLIDQGKEDLGIPAYNGGLFDADEHDFLTEHGVADEYLAEVIYRISTTKTDDGEFVLADYADLDTRHLGSIYEGLLEHEFRIAPEQYAAVSEDGGQVWKPATEVSVADAVESVPAGGLYVVNDDGERKSTGSYYTPDYVVTYIVEETIDPLIEEIKDELRADGLEPSDRQYFMRFWQSVQELKILDPAMGSGHFLTKATGYLTERVMEVVREQELQSYDEQEFRRRISKECIYGVDLNGMAVELAKLSMWLETLAADQPLAFLDHHLKTGNSLVGSDISEILSTDDEGGPSGQTTLSDWMEQTRREALEHVMDLMQDLLDIDNDELSDIKEMERTYEEIRSDPLFVHLLEMASVHTASQFGLDVPDDADEQMAKALRDDSWEDVAETDWFKSAQAMAETEQFFHWELEFPEVFFGESGDLAGDAGFDVVLGNPPYVRQEQLKSAKSYFQTRYDTYHSAADLYTYFLELGYKVLRNSKSLGFIVSNKFMHSEYGQKLRSKLSKQTKIRRAIDFHSLPVFGREVSAYPLILIFDKEEALETHKPLIGKVPSLDFADLRREISDIGYEVKQKSFGDNGWRIQNPQLTKIINKIEKDAQQLVDYIDVPLRRGILTGLNEAFILEKEEYQKLDLDDKHVFSLLRGRDIHRYRVDYEDRHLIRIPSGWTKSAADVKTEAEAWDWFKSEHTQLAKYLSKFRSDAENRHDRGDCWWELRPCDYYKELEGPKIVYPVISKGPNFALDTDGHHINDKLYSIPTEDYKLLAILNSNLTRFWVQAELSGLRGGYQEFRAVHVEQVPIKHVTEDGELSELAQDAIETREKRDRLNLSLLDHLGNYTKGEPLPEIGFSQPPKDSADSILHETTETREKLQIERATVERENPSTVTINLTARYKPEDEDGHDLDQYGYTETEFLPALRITDLTETEADLIEAFVPVAVEEAGGFAGFRDNATKTNSLIDRLKGLTLPEVADVEDGLQSYIETKERAEELDEKIQKTDYLIDQIVYELYGLTDEEIEIVESATSD